VNRYHHPVVRDALDEVLVNRWFHMPRYRARMRRVVHHLLAALAIGQDIETFALTRFDFWYKVFFITPYGVLKADSCGELWEKEAFARHVIHARDLRRVPVVSVMENWHAGDLREKSRPLAGLLLHQWRQTMKKPSPAWIEQCRPEPEPGALRVLIARMQPRRCCPSHSAMDSALKAAMQAPAGPCFLCGSQSVWRQGWPPPTAAEPMQTPCCAIATAQDTVVYIDLCQHCHLDPGSPARIAEVMHQRQATWN